MPKTTVYIKNTGEKLYVQIMGVPAGRLEYGGPELLLSFEPLVGQKLNVTIGMLEVQSLPGVVVNPVVNFTPNTGSMQELEIPHGSHNLMVTNGVAELGR